MHVLLNYCHSIYLTLSHNHWITSLHHWILVIVWLSIMSCMSVAKGSSGPIPLACNHSGTFYDTLLRTLSTIASSQQCLKAASSPGHSQFFNVTCRKTGGPDIRSHVTNVMHTKGGWRVKIKRGQHTGNHTLLATHFAGQCSTWKLWQCDRSERYQGSRSCSVMQSSVKYAYDQR